VLTTRPTRVKECVRHSLNRIGSYHKNALNLLTLYLLVQETFAGKVRILPLYRFHK